MTKNIRPRPKSIMNKRGLPIVITSFSLIASITVTYFWQTDTRPPQKSEITEEADVYRAVDIAIELNSAGSDDFKFSGNNLSDLHRILKINDFFERTSLLRHLYEKWSANDPQGAANSLVVIDPEFRDYEVLGLVAESLARKNTAQALAFSSSIAQSDYRMGDFIREKALLIWNEENPQAAIEWSFSNVPSAQQAGIVGKLVGDWATRSPQEAFNFAQTLNETSLRTRSMAMAFRGASETNVQTALGILGQLDTADEARSIGARIIASQWSKKQPEETVSWALSLAVQDPARESVLTTSISNWSVEDPIAASNAFGNISDVPLKDRLIGAFVASASISNPEITTSWARNIQDPTLRRNAFLTIANSYKDKSPEISTIWLGTIQDLPSEWMSEMETVLNRR